MSVQEHITISFADGSPVRLTSTQADPTAPLWVRKFEAQLDSDDGPTAYIGTHGVVTGKTNCQKSIGAGQDVCFEPSEYARGLGECLNLAAYDAVGTAGETLHILIERG